MEQKDKHQEIIPPNFGPKWEAEIRIKSEKVDRLTEIPYVPGFEEYAAYSPFLEKNTLVVMRFSWGKNAPNMSGKHVDESNGEAAEDNLLNASIFLDSQPFKTDSKVVHVIGNFQGTQYQIQEISSLDFKSDHDDPTNLIVDENDSDFAEKRDLDIQANFVFTRDPNVVLTIKPADCPIVVGYCKDKDGKDIAFIDHMGADAKNAGISRQGLLYLKDVLGVDLSTVKVTILPGVSKKHYDISNEPERRGNGIVESNWNEFIDPKYPDYIVEMLLMKDPDYPKMSKEQKDVKREAILNGQKRHVDIMEATIVELLEAGVLPENIQPIIVDSYEAAEKGESYSHRFTIEHDGARKGRSFAAVQLKPKD